MLVLRFGKIRIMDLNAIFGHLVALCTRFAPLKLLLEEKIYKLYIKKWLKESTKSCQKDIQIGYLKQ